MENTNIEMSEKMRRRETMRGTVLTLMGGVFWGLAGVFGKYSFEHKGMTAQWLVNVRLIIAHIGRAYTRGDVGNAFETLDKLPDLMYDFSANCCEYSITEVIRHAGPKHVMFGTDMPILRMRTHRIEENGTYINLVPPGLYGDPSADPHLREVSAEEAKKITFFAYEELLAFKRASKTLNLTRQDIEDIMYNNAANMIAGARKSIYGE